MKGRRVTITPDVRDAFRRLPVDVLEIARGIAFGTGDKAQLMIRIAETILAERAEADRWAARNAELERRLRVIRAAADGAVAQ